MNRRVVLWLLLAAAAILWLPWIGSVVITPDLPTFLNVAALILTGLLVLVTIQWPYRLPFVLRRGAVLGTLWALVNAAYVINRGWPWIGTLYSVAILGAMAFGAGPLFGWYNYQKAAAPSDRERTDAEIAKLEQALAQQEAQLEKARQRENRRQQAALWLQIGNLQKQLDAWERAAESYRQAVALWQQVGGRNQLLLALSNLGLVEIRDRPDLAVETFRQMLALSRQSSRFLRGILWLLGWPYQGAEIISLVNIGAACDRLKQPQQALAVLEPAVKASRKYGYTIALAYALNNLGSAQAENEPLQALDHYRQALRHCTGLVRNAAAKIIITANIADIHRRLGEYERAFDLLEGLQASVRQVKSRSLEGVVLRNLGQVYRDAGEPGHALAIFSRAMDYARATGHFSYAAAVLADVSEINLTLGRRPEAITALLQAIAILESHSLPNDIEGRTAEHLHARLAQLHDGAKPEPA